MTDRLDDDDQLRFLFASAFEHGGPADDCPAPEVLLDTLDCTLAADARGAVVDHLAACPVCAEAWRLLVLARAVDP
ncbi:MAG: hypothetical protein ABMB14_18590 [Myxococcota bacterium]